MLNPKTAVRQSVQADGWKLERLFRFKWKSPEHINSLELRAILQAIRFYTSHFHVTHTRIFHVTDSYVCMRIVAGGRAGSRLLGRTLKKINAFLLGFGLYVVLAHVESTENPTDEASRFYKFCARRTKEQRVQDRKNVALWNAGSGEGLFASSMMHSVDCSITIHG